jgi:hypothetical protein
VGGAAVAVPVPIPTAAKLSTPAMPSPAAILLKFLT